MAMINNSHIDRSSEIMGDVCNFVDTRYQRDQRISLLYVDDEPSLLISGKKYLEHWYGFEVTTAENAEEALSQIGDSSFDVIISDYQMPGMDGIGYHSISEDGIGIENGATVTVKTGEDRK